jgi:hypothetical protein
MAGRSVRFTPKSLLVIVRHRQISLRRSSFVDLVGVLGPKFCYWCWLEDIPGVGWVSPVNVPKPPAFDTADESSAYPTHCIPACMTGTGKQIS